MLQIKNLFVVAFVGMLCILGCQKHQLPEEAKKVLIGEYDLFIGSNQNYERKDIDSSSLKLLSDGTFRQQCKYKDNTEIVLDGTWNYSKGKVNFSKFADCAGAWPVNWATKDGGASLVVEMSDSPTILLNPDISIFYAKEGKIQKNPQGQPLTSDK